MAFPSVLIVDDEASVRIVVQRLLSGKGYRPIVAADGEEALKFLDGRDFDLVLTDLRMPGMDGLQLAKAVKKSRPGADVILMTALPTLETAVEGLQNGLHDYLVKPFAPDTLLAVLGRWRRQWELRRVVAETERALGGALEEILTALQDLAGSLPKGPDRDRAMKLLIRSRELSGVAENLRAHLRRP